MNAISRTLAIVAACVLLLSATNLWAVDRIVGTTGALSTALAAAQPGDFITLTPGVYNGGHFRAGLTDVTIRSQNPLDPAIIRGGANGFQLSDATRVTLKHLIFEQQTGNGLNIDDGGSFATPSTDITLRHLVVRDMNAGGNNDGIKLSGVTGFLIENVLVENWGGGGSAIDPVGSHNGLIQNSIFRHTTGGSSGIRPKGGSKNIAILANRFEMPGGFGRAIQAGGSTGSQFFRFIDGDSGYEADNITAAGNLIVDAHAAISWANIDGGIFHHNWIENPRNWAMRILNENQGSAIVDTQHGLFADNVITYDGNAWNRPANVGGETLSETFTFARNQWNNTTGATNVNLPAPETDGQYGSITVPRIDDQIRWDFSWGHWVVNASASAAGAPMSIPGAANLLVATRGVDGVFEPLDDDPLTGNWSFAPLAGANVQLAAQSQQILITPDSTALVSQIPGDFDRSGTVDAADYDLWKQQFGLTGPALADGNGDNVVSAADYTLWRDHLGETVPLGIVSPTVVPAPAAGSSAAIAVAGLLLARVRSVAAIMPESKRIAP